MDGGLTSIGFSALVDGRLTSNTLVDIGLTSGVWWTVVLVDGRLTFGALVDSGHIYSVRVDGGLTLVGLPLAYGWTVD